MAVKTYNSLHRQPSEPTHVKSTTYAIGRIGETVTEHVFGDTKSDHVFGESEYGQQLEDLVVQQDPSQQLPQIKMDLNKYGVQLDDTISGVLKETIEGLGRIKKQISDQYGEIDIIGRGESRNGPLASTAKPDFVAMVDGQKKPVLIEVKNSKIANTTADKFQARFYNMVGRKFGITVMEDHKKSDSWKIMPKTVRKKISETMLIYPRLGKFEIVKDAVKLDRAMIRDIWTAKQLGMKGRSPKTDCDSSCPHHRYDKLPEDNMDAAIPLPLIYSKGMTEQEINLDAAYWRLLVRKKGIRAIVTGFRNDCLPNKFQADRINDAGIRNRELKKINMLERDFIKDISERTGLARKWIQSNRYYDTRISEEKDKKIERDMVNEIEPWKKIFGTRKFKKTKINAKAQGTRLYSLPKNSRHFVKRSWDEWA